MTPIDPSIGPDRARELFRAELADGRVRHAELQALRTRWVGRNDSWVAAFMEALEPAPRPSRRRRSARAPTSSRKKSRPRSPSAKRRSPRRAGPASAVDITLPGRAPLLGHRHPLSLIREEVSEIFTRLGYQVLEGPEIEDDYHNFEALNMPAEHPARDMQDTLYLAEPLMPRDRTTPPTRGLAPHATAAADAAAHAHLARCRSGTWSSTIRRCGWSRSARSIAATTST